ncbi:Hypothetical predicted protein, partial [Olea europaea subsp. europaea]
TSLHSKIQQSRNFLGLILYIIAHFEDEDSNELCIVLGSGGSVCWKITSDGGGQLQPARAELVRGGNNDVAASIRYLLQKAEGAGALPLWVYKKSKPES